MDKAPNRAQHLFVVRLWHEPSMIAPPGQWRGSVNHVPSGKQFYFVALQELNEFIRLQLDEESKGISVSTGLP